MLGKLCNGCAADDAWLDSPMTQKELGAIEEIEQARGAPEQFIEWPDWL